MKKFTLVIARLAHSRRGNQKYGVVKKNRIGDVHQLHLFRIFVIRNIHHDAANFLAMVLKFPFQSYQGILCSRISESYRNTCTYIDMKSLCSRLYGSKFYEHERILMSIKLRIHAAIKSRKMSIFWLLPVTPISRRYETAVCRHLWYLVIKITY